MQEFPFLLPLAVFLGERLHMRLFGCNLLVFLGGQAPEVMNGGANDALKLVVS